MHTVSNSYVYAKGYMPNVLYTKFDSTINFVVQIRFCLKTKIVMWPCTYSQFTVTVCLLNFKWIK